MKSPFPGMDPFIEGCGLWEDFHDAVIQELKNSLAQTVPDHYLVRTGERAYVVLATPDGESFVEVREASSEEKLVTCIEVLSPSNKRPGTQGWEIYQRKRQGFLMGSANLVEIDLLRGGQRLPMIDSWPDSPNTLLVARKTVAPVCNVRRASFMNPLPAIPVPLIKPDPDVLLNLQPMIEAIYARSRYARSIDYSKALTPPLSAEETAWLQLQIKT